MLQKPVGPFAKGEVLAGQDSRKSAVIPSVQPIPERTVSVLLLFHAC
jgi:hypothetical protein